MKSTEFVRYHLDFARILMTHVKLSPVKHCPAPWPGSGLVWMAAWCYDACLGWHLCGHLAAGCDGQRAGARRGGMQLGTLEHWAATTFSSQSQSPPPTGSRGQSDSDVHWHRHDEIQNIRHICDANQKPTSCEKHTINWNIVKLLKIADEIRNYMIVEIT